MLLQKKNMFMLLKKGHTFYGNILFILIIRFYMIEHNLEDYCHFIYALNLYNSSLI